MTLKDLKDSKLMTSFKHFCKVGAKGISSAFKSSGHVVQSLMQSALHVAQRYFLEGSYYVGRKTLLALSSCKKAGVRWTCRFWKRLHPIRNPAARGKNAFSFLKDGALLPFVKLKSKWHCAGGRLKQARANGTEFFLKEIGKLIGSFFTALLKFLWGSLSYVAPVAAVFVLVSVVNSYNRSVHYAVAVDYDGQLLGYISEESVYDEAQTILQSRLVNTEDRELLNQQPSYSLAVVSEENEIEASELCDKIIEASGSVITEATGFYIDGELIGAVEDSAQLETDLNAMLDQYRTGAEGEQVGFVQDVSLQTGLYPATSVADYSVISDLVHSEKEGLKTYTVESGDAPLSIAAAYDMSLDDLVALNPTIESKLLVGDTVVISNSVPYLSIQVTRNETYTEEIPYETETVSDRNYYVGYSKVKTEGVNGTQEINANITYVDGVAVNTDVLSTTVVSEPVDEVVVKGSLAVTGYSTSRGSSTIASSVSTGSYGWPVGGSGGYISCGWWGYYGHNGIDIASSYGTPILASDAGVVVKAGWDSTGFGRVVIIDHGNGVKTLYGHNSSLAVSVGQTVSKGQVIAYMGSTGNSYGTHCHFSIIVNGVYKNPAPYLG